MSAAKLRPAVVLADATRGDLVLCQVTSQPYADPQAIELTAADFATGALPKISYARPGKLFTANATIITKQLGELTPEKQREIVQAVIALLQKSLVP